MEELLKGLGFSQEDISKILEGMKAGKLFVTKEEKIEERYNKLKEQKSSVDAELLEAQNTIADLKKSNKDNEALRQKIQAFESQIATLKEENSAKLKNLSFDNAINNALVSSGVKHKDLLANLFDREKLSLNDKGEVKGIDEQLNNFKEQYKDLFEVKLGGTEPASNFGGNANNSYEALLSNADNMTSEQIAEVFNKI